MLANQRRRLALHRPADLFTRTRGPAFFTLVSATGPAVGLLTGTLSARLLTPSELGAIQTALLLLPYLSFIGLGVYHGLNREYPYLFGRGEPERAVELVGASLRFTKWATLATVILASAYALVLSIRSGNPLLMAAALCAIPIVGVYPFSTQYEVLYRTNHDFLRFGWIQLIGYLISIVTMSLVFVLGFYGQCIRLIINAFANLFLRWVWRPVKSVGTGNWADTKHLAVVGLPLLIVGYGLNLFGVADRSVVALQLGTEAVGYYSLTTIILSSMTAFPMAIAQVLSPRAAVHYGSTGQARGLRRFVWITLLLSAVVLWPLALVGWWVLPSLVTWLLPNYVPGINAARVGLIAGALATPGLEIVFMVLKRNSLYLAAIAVSTGMIWVLSTLAIGLGGNLVAVAWARVLATIALSACSIAYALYLTR